MSATSRIAGGELRYGEHGIEAEYWLDELSTTQPEALGANVARRRRVGELVVGAIEAGGSAEDVVAALVMTGAARRVVRLRDRLPVIRSFERRRVNPHFELIDG